MIDFRYIGWCHEGTSDKIWVRFVAEGNQYVAWGRRDAKLQFKNHGAVDKFSNLLALDKVQREKSNKGYKEVDQFQLFSIFPDFQNKVESELLMNALQGKV